jgi:hypothetical protein
MATQKEIRAAQAAYLREWRKKNPEKNRMYCESYWNRRIERMKAEQQTSQTTGATPENQKG